MGNNQPKVSSFFALKNASAAEDASSNPVCMVDDVAESSLICGKEEKYVEVAEIEERTQSDERFEYESRDGTINSASAHCCAATLESCGAEPTFMKVGQGTNFWEELRESPDESCTSGSSHFLNKPNTGELLSSAFKRQSSKGHSTLGDPNFVENYFKVLFRYPLKLPANLDGLLIQSSMKHLLSHNGDY